MTETTSKYRFVEMAGGALAIDSPDRTPVKIVFSPAGIVPYYYGRYDSDMYEWSDDHSDRDVRRWRRGNTYNLYHYYGFSRAVGRLLMYGWQMPEEHRKRYEEKGWDPGMVPRWARKWLAKQAAGTVGKRLHAHWKAQLDRIDPPILAMHRALFSVCPSRPAVPDPAFLDNPRAVADIACIRGAAAVVAALWTVGRHYTERKYPDMDWAQRDVLARQLPARLAERWDLWPMLLSDTFEPYHALNATLTNLPGGIRINALPALGYVHLERPITDRLELATLLAYLGQEHVQENERIFLHATNAEIRRALMLVSEHLRQSLSHRRIADIARFTQFLNDYREPHRGGVVGLAKKAVDYHRHQLEDERRRVVELYGGEQEVARPPIALPTTAGVQFLATVADLAVEGRMMCHCVAGYAERAVHGHCYLFHVEKDEEMATVEVSPYGKVMQASGPLNGQNGAVKYGRRVLAAWGRRIPEGAEPVLPEIQDGPAQRHEQIVIEDDPLLGGLVVPGRNELHALAALGGEDLLF